jgi:sec-independent protein translocase protein TatB
MFGLGWSEILIIAVVAILVVPPKDLPGLMRTVGHAVGRVRRMATQFQREIEDAVRNEELDKLRTQVRDLGRETETELRGLTAYERRTRVVTASTHPAMTPLPAPPPETPAPSEPVGDPSPPPAPAKP